MTREEAVKILKDHSEYGKADFYTSDEYYEALDMAISALSENKCFEGMTNGEVMNLVLRKVFPRIIFIRGVNEYNKTKSIVYSEEWENVPYKGVSE